MPRLPSPRLRGAVLVALVATGCDDGPPTVSREALETATFLTAEGGTVTLSEGVATDPASGVQYELLTVGEGDVDFDGESDAAAILVERRGDARILRLHALLGGGEHAEDVSARLIGDRLGVQRLSIEDGVIRLELKIRNPGEPISVEPSVIFAQHFVLTDRGLTPIVQTQVDDDGGEGRRAAGDRPMDDAPALYTHEWHLDAIAAGDWAGEPEALDRPVSVRFVAELADVAGASGQFSGFAGCNRIFGSFRAEESAILRIAGLASTRRMCDSKHSDFEQRFLAAFGSVESFEIQGDRLVLAFVGGTLEFRAGGRLIPSEPETSVLENPAPVQTEPEEEARRRS